MLLGYRYNNEASSPRTGRSFDADWISESHTNAADYKTNFLDDDWDKESEKGEESIKTYA
jgi:hypothetical protein